MAPASPMSRSSNRTANSSPPSRVSRSLSLRSCFSRILLSVDEDLVAGAVAEGVVDVLEPVKVHDQDDAVDTATGPGDDAGQVRFENAPVGKTGEKVVGGLEDQFLLMGLAVRDVGAGADVTGESAVEVLERPAQAQDPAVATVVPPEPELRFERFPGFKGRQEYACLNLS